MSIWGEAGLPFFGLGVALLCGLVVSALWWRLAVRGLKDTLDGTAHPAIGTLSAQLWFLCALVALIHGGLAAAMVIAIVPAFFVVPALDLFPLPAGLIQSIAVIPLGLSALTLVAALWSRATQPYAVILAGFVGLTSAVMVGERHSRSAMCETATARGLTDIRRNTLWWSIRNVPQEVQLDIHGIALDGDARHGWSYAEMDWYLIPEHAWGDVETTEAACP